MSFNMKISGTSTHPKNLVIAYSRPPALARYKVPNCAQPSENVVHNNSIWGIFLFWVSSCKDKCPFTDSRYKGPENHLILDNLYQPEAPSWCYTFLTNFHISNIHFTVLLNDRVGIKPSTSLKCLFQPQIPGNHWKSNGKTIWKNNTSTSYPYN